MENNENVNKNIAIETNSGTNNKKNSPPRFNISLDRRWIKWLLVVFIFLILFLLLRLTGVNNIVINAILSIIPLLIALAVCWGLNPLIRFLTKRGFSKSFSKYFTFFISLIIGLTFLVGLIYLVISQTKQLMDKALGDTEVINNLIYSWFKKRSSDSDGNYINMLFDVYGFSYDEDQRVYVVNTNIEWDKLKSEWEKILTIIAQQIAKTDSKAWRDFLQNFIDDHNIRIVGENKFSINYLGNSSNPEQFYDYFQKLFKNVSGFLSSIGLKTINLKEVNPDAINKALSGYPISLQIGALYRLILQLSIKSRWIISATFLLDIIESIYNSTNISRLATVLFRDYLSIFSTILYSLFIAIMITMFILGEYLSVKQFIKTRVLPGKNQDQKDRLLNALQRSLFTYTRGLIINMVVMFFGMALMLWIIGYSLNSDTYKKGFVILALFMAITNLVPYVGPIIGIIPIILAGIIDVTTSEINVTYLSNWTPLILAILWVIIMKIFERLALARFLFAKAIKVHPATILVCISLFAVALGIFWMILALPAVATIKAICHDVYRKEIPL